MAHDHSHPNHSHGPSLNRKNKMVLAVGITAAILLLEAVGGILSGSLALLSDAGHMLTDLAALFISLTAMILAERPTSRTHTFGLARLEVLAALGNSLTFFLMVSAIGWQAWTRFSQPSLPYWKAMGVVAGIGLFAHASS